jgi:hypothetical protein
MTIVDKREFEKTGIQGSLASAAEIRMKNKLPEPAGNTSEDHGECLV